MLVISEWKINQTVSEEIWITGANWQLLFLPLCRQRWVYWLADEGAI